MEDFDYREYYENNDYKSIINHIPKNGLDWYSIIEIQNLVIIMHSYYELTRYDETIICGKQIIKRVLHDSQNFVANKKDLELTYLLLASSYRKNNRKLLEYFSLIKLLLLVKIMNKTHSTELDNLEGLFAKKIINTSYFILLVWGSFSLFEEFKHSYAYTLFLGLVLGLILYDVFILKDKTKYKLKKIIRKLAIYLAR